MKNTIKTLLALFVFSQTAFTAIAIEESIPLEENDTENRHPIYLEAAITIDEAIEIQKSTIFDASQSFIPNPEKEVSYSWDFGDGNKNEGIEVLHAYKNPGNYTIKLTINDGTDTSTLEKKVFAYRKLIVLITDKKEAQARIEIFKNFAEEKGVFIKVIESFGSSTEFISEEVLTKKMNEEAESLQKATQIAIWTKENAGLNSLSRYLQGNQNKISTNFSQKTITLITDNINSNIGRIQRQYDLIKPKSILVTKEAGIDRMIESQSDKEFIDILEKGGYEYAVINSKTGKVRPWNFMSYFVNMLIENGIPDNTIALLLLLPVIATVVAFMKQFVGITTFGIYTPSIITLSFLVIGVYAGLLTLTAAILVGAVSRPLLKKVRMLFIPKMAIVITLVSLTLLLILIASIFLNLFDAQFLSIAIFPMLILSTLVEKFVSVKSNKGLSSAAALMISTVIVAIIAYFIAGGEINIGIATIKFNFVKEVIMNYPELVFLLIVINVILGKWSGLRVLERIRFREILRHIEEE